MNVGCLALPSSPRSVFLAVMLPQRKENGLENLIRAEALLPFRLHWLLLLSVSSPQVPHCLPPSQIPDGGTALLPTSVPKLLSLVRHCSVPDWSLPYTGGCFHIKEDSLAPLRMCCGGLSWETFWDPFCHSRDLSHFHVPSGKGANILIFHFRGVLTLSVC